MGDMNAKEDDRQKTLNHEKYHVFNKHRTTDSDKSFNQTANIE
jgi:hypothetical protein